MKTTKVCRDCKQRKPRTDFYVKERRKWAIVYFSRCKPCYYRYVRKLAQVAGKAPSQERLSDRHSAARTRARLALKNAVQRGTVTKPTECTDCGRKMPRRRLHGHHTDYDKPLDVVWLCNGCHQARHR